MTSFFENVKENVGDKAIILLLYPFVVVIFIISVGISYQDYMSSYYGYLLFPTQKVKEGWWVVPGIALLPQIVTFPLYYGVVKGEVDGFRDLKIGMMYAMFFIDSFSDVYYKVNGDLLGNISVTVFAIFETLIVFNLMSEVLMVLSWGLMIELTPLFLGYFGLTVGDTIFAIVKAVGQIFSSIKDSFVFVFDAFFSGEDDGMGKKKNNYGRKKDRGY